MEAADADSDVETLPSDVSSEVDLPPAVEPDESLPTIIDGGSASDQCCNQGCLEALAESRSLSRRVLELRQSLEQGTQHQKETLQFHCLKDWGKGGKGWRRYKAWGMSLCQTAVQNVLGLTMRKMKKLNKQIEQGLLQPERSLQATQNQRQDRPGSQKAETCLSWLYHNVAEDLAESVRLGDEGQPSSATARSLPQVSTISFLDNLEDEEKGVRWMPPGTTLAEMLDCAITFLPHCKHSYSTFVTHYHLQWAKRLKIRAEGHHSKCTACEKFKAYRKQVTAPSDCKRVAEEYTSHLKDVLKDRETDRRLCVTAQITCGTVPGVVSEESSLLSISIDAMDAAKFRCPRNIGAAKEFQNLWRPELTMVGAITEGLHELYFVCDPDLSKNADLHCTIVGHCIERAHEAFQARGRPFPRHLRLQTDNATAEGKNATVFCLASFLAQRRMFSSVTCSQFRVGHTHSKIDQRFSEVRNTLSQCNQLEDPDSFCAAIQTGVNPREKRELVVERVRAAANFKEFFQQLEIKVSGHTQTKKKTERNEEAVHCFSFERRDERPEDDEADDLAPASSDIIMTCRQYLSDRENSQKPCVFAKEADFQKLGSIHELSPRVSYSQRQCKEFEKTANVIAQAPWNMHKGCAFLLKSMTENLENESDEWVPPKMTWVLQGVPDKRVVEGEDKTEALPEDTFNWNHTTAALVTVARPPQKMRRLQVKQPQLVDATAPAMPASGPEVRDDDGAAGSDADVLPPDAGVEDAEMAPPPPIEGDEMRGAPKSMYGTGGAPAHTALPLPSTPSAKSKAKAKAKSAAKPKAKAKSAAAAAKPKAKAKVQVKAKAKAKSGAPGRRNLGLLPMPPDAASVLGCSRCRHSSVGCRNCRSKAGLVLNGDMTAWEWQDQAER